MISSIRIIITPLVSRFCTAQIFKSSLDYRFKVIIVKMDAMVNEPQEEIEMIEGGTKGPQTKESSVGEGDDDGEQGDDDGEQRDDDGERPLWLGDLEKVWVPMRMDGTNEFVACCGYEASRFKGTSLDDATPELWRKAQ